MPADYSFVLGLEDINLRKEVMRELSKKDLYFLCKFVLGYADMETRTDIHYKLCEELDTDPARYLALIFRGSFKTSIGLGKCIQWIINNPEVQIGVGSDIKERAEERVRDLRNMLATNELLKELFPEILYSNPDTNAPLWRQDEFSVKRKERGASGEGFQQATVSAFGLDPLPTGAHYTHVLLDDVENDKNCFNDELIRKLNRQLQLFLPVLRPEAPVVMLGTIYNIKGPNTIYQKYWKTYKRPIHLADGTPTFPRKFPLHIIKRMKEEMFDQWMWRTQFMMESTDVNDTFFYPFRDVQLNKVEFDGEWIYRGTYKTNIKDCNIVVTIDPGGGAGEHDQAITRSIVDKVGVCVNAVDRHGRWCFLEWFCKHYTDDEFIDLLFLLYDRWHPGVIGIEKMPHLDPYIRLAFRTRGRSVPISELKPKRRPKATRIRALGPLWKNIDVISTIECERHVQTWYTEQEHDDDDLDAAAYQIDIARAPTKEGIEDRKAKIEAEDETRRLKELPPADHMEWEHWLKLKNKKYTRQEAWQHELEDFYYGESGTDLDEFGNREVNDYFTEQYA